MAATNKWFRVFCILALTFSTFVWSASNLRAETHKPMTGVTSECLIKATPEEVFEAIKTYRRADAAKRTVLEEKKNKAIIKEKFPAVPVLGDVSCTYEETEVPYTRIDFQLINSDKLKVFEGNWQLSPVNDGKQTLVRLTSYVDSDVNVPAKDFLQHIQTHEDIHKRMAFVKKIAETEDAQKKG